jgi:hypothetical protein
MAPRWPQTNVVMLGRLKPTARRIENPSTMPSPRENYLPAYTTPIEGQNVIKQIVMNGVHGVRGGLGALTGFGDLPADPVATVAPAAPTASAPRSAMQQAVYVSVTNPWFIAARTVSSAASLYHGYKRHGGSLLWGMGWFLMGSLFPVVTPTVALAQGFGKNKRG